jgi:hypothetical protein
MALDKARKAGSRARKVRVKIILGSLFVSN